jgi:eukaryotic-like serine/threonine-protein kinase
MKTMVSTAGGQAHGPLEADDVLPPGSKAGPWVVERELGRGGMGAVYGVVHDEIGKRAALKIVHARLLTPGFNADRMLLEAKVVNQVGHPNIVDIFETGRLPDGRPYIVMERLEGQPLAYRADDGKILPDQVIAILLQVCDALIAAHAAGIVHRDLKLDNVFLVDNPDDLATPRVKVLDWGIAKVLSHDVHHTVEGQLVGTPQYLAPEQARGAQVSPQTDVYSLGVMAYELFLEQLPFEAETSAEIMAMHLRATPPPPRELWPDIPAPLEELLLEMLAKSPDRRPTMLEVARRLEAIREELRERQRQAFLASPTCATSAPPMSVSAIAASPIAAPPIAAPPIAEPPIAAPPIAAPPIAEPRRSSAPQLVRPPMPPVVPPLPAVARLRDSAEGHAPTVPAELTPANKRWQWAVGVAALVTGAMLFVISRTGDTRAETATPAVLPAAEPELAIAEAADEPDGELELAHHEPELAHVDTTEPAQPDTEEARIVPAVRRHTSRSGSARPAVHRPSARREPVKPRRSNAIDPDGTIDPFR